MLPTQKVFDDGEHNRVYIRKLLINPTKSLVVDYSNKKKTLVAVGYYKSVESREKQAATVLSDCYSTPAHRHVSSASVSWALANRPAQLVARLPPRRPERFPPCECQRCCRQCQLCRCEPRRATTPGVPQPQERRQLRCDQLTQQIAARHRERDGGRRRLPALDAAAARPRRRGRLQEQRQRRVELRGGRGVCVLPHAHQRDGGAASVAQRGRAHEEHAPVRLTDEDVHAPPAAAGPPRTASHTLQGGLCGSGPAASPATQRLRRSRGSGSSTRTAASCRFGERARRHRPPPIPSCAAQAVQPSAPLLSSARNADEYSTWCGLRMNEVSGGKLAGETQASRASVSGDW